jgi:protein-disulfide isomerase
MRARISLTFADPERDHIQGSAGAPIKLLEYGDYECPFCADAHSMVQEIQRRLGDDLLFAFRNFPLTNIHPHSDHAAEAAEAAFAQGDFWGMHDMLFENQAALEDEDLAAYAAELGLDAERLLREVTSSIYAARIREDFKAGVRGGVERHTDILYQRRPLRWGAGSKTPA